MAGVDLFFFNGQSLLAIQQQIKIVSDNVAHAQDSNYNRRDVSYDTLSGVGVAVKVDRAVNLDLRNQVLDATSTVASNDETLRIFNNLATTIGTNANNTGYIQDKLSAVQAAWNNFEASPQNAAAEQTVVRASDDFAGEIRRQFASLRTQESAESGVVQQDITDLNSKLNQIAAVNLQAQSEQTSATGLRPETRDQLDALAKDVAKYLPINVFERSDGSISIFSKSGTPLVDKVANQFSWDPKTRNIYQSQGSPPAAYGLPGSLDAAFANGQIGAKVLALDPTTPPTAGTAPGVGVFQKYREQLKAFVDLFAATSSTPSGTNSAFDAAFVQNPSDRSSDIIQTTGTSTGATTFVTQPTTPLPSTPIPASHGGFFYTSKTAVGSAVAIDEESFAVNPYLLTGALSVNRQAASAIISFFTSTNQSLGSPTPIGGLTLVNRTPQGLITGITGFFASNKATVQAKDDAATATVSDLKNRLSARVGVNSDDELARLQVLQNSYAATGRILSAADTLFQTLLSIGNR